MTQKMYWESDATQASVEVLQCKQLANGLYGLSLHATPFHPQGGGQPADIGTVGDAEVLGVEIMDGEIVHYTNQPLALGITTAQVDATRRGQHSRLHSAGYLVGHAMESLGWQAVKAHHWPGEARVVVAPSTDTQATEVSRIQKICDELIARNLPRNVQIDKNQFRQVAFGDLAPYGCGGTHVAATAELHGLEILSVQMKKGQLIVQYHID